MTTYDFGFVLEQALGHVTHAKNLQAHVPLDPEVRAHWALVDFETKGIAGRIPVYRSNWTVRSGIRARWQLAAIARRVNLHALFFHTQVPAVLAQHWLRKIPSIVSLDATPMQYDELGGVYRHETGPAWLESLKWRLNCSCYRAARRLVVWSEWTRRGLVRDYEVADDKIEVVPPGVIVRDWLRPVPRSAHNDSVRILFVGADLERKGGDVLIEAFRALRRPGLELHLVTKSSVPPEPGVFVYNDIQPNSRELKELYHRCDVFALPTLGDCLPMVLSEAGASGLPSVSTNVAGIPEIVQDGQTGFTVPPGDLGALVQALRPLLDNPELRLELGSRARLHVSRDYDAEKNSARLLQLLKLEAGRPMRAEN
jgi:glycosyltransferase involved in cell wall biosynthesis